MITVLFFTFVALVVFHFIYDGIIAPSLRYEIRLQLFEMRDNLRHLKIEYGSRLEDELFEALQDDINKQIRGLHNITVVSVFEAIRLIIGNRELDRRVEEIDRLVNESEIDGIKTIYHNTAFKFGIAFLANSGGWIIYAAPLIILMLFSLVTFGSVWRLTTKILQIPDDRIGATA